MMELYHAFQNFYINLIVQITITYFVQSPLTSAFSIFHFNNSYIWYEKDRIMAIISRANLRFKLQLFYMNIHMNAHNRPLNCLIFSSWNFHRHLFEWVHWMKYRNDNLYDGNRIISSRQIHILIYQITNISKLGLRESYFKLADWS